VNVAQSKTGAGLVIRMTPKEFDRFAAAGRYVGMLETEEGTKVVALVIAEEKAA